MPRIAVDVNALVEDLLADSRFTAGRGEWTASFFSTARVETEGKEPEQIGDCLWLENPGIRAGPAHSRIAGVEGFPDRFIRHSCGVEFRHVEVVAKEVTRAGPIGRSGGCRQTHQTRLFIDEVAVLRGGRAGCTPRLVKGCADHFCFFAGGDYVVDGFRTSGDRDV